MTRGDKSWDILGTSNQFVVFSGWAVIDDGLIPLQVEESNYRQPSKYNVIEIVWTVQRI